MLVEAQQVRHVRGHLRRQPGGRRLLQAEGGVAEPSSEAAEAFKSVARQIVEHLELGGFFERVYGAARLVFLRYNGATGGER